MLVRSMPWDDARFYKLPSTSIPSAVSSVFEAHATNWSMNDRKSGSSNVCRFSSSSTLSHTALLIGLSKQGSKLSIISPRCMSSSGKVSVQYFLNRHKIFRVDEQHNFCCHPGLSLFVHIQWGEGITDIPAGSLVTV